MQIPKHPTTISVLVTDRSNKRITGHNLDGGARVSFTFDSVTNPAVLAEGVTKWNRNDIATLDLDADKRLEQIRIVVPDGKASILKFREFEIVDVECTSGNIGGPYDDGGRYVLLNGKTEDGTEYVMPMLSDSFYKPVWDLSDLENALINVQIAQYEGRTPETRLSHENTSRAVYAFHTELRPLVNKFNDIFYPGERDSATLFDMATSIHTRRLKMNQTGTATRAQMIVAAFVVNGQSTLPPLTQSPHARRGLALSPPYFEIGGKRVFIRTSPKTNEPAPSA